jgi:hypothetical protein
MKRMISAFGIAGVVGASLVCAAENKNAIATDRISLFEVPLRCEAAPEIGCGTRSKPILLQLEQEPAIEEAWLNGAGTVLAVVWAENSRSESGTKIVQTVLERNGITSLELDGEARDKEAKSFISGDTWYHGAEVDNLSKQEARIIAARLIRRVQAKVALSEGQTKALETGWATVVARCFIGSPDNSTSSREEKLNEQLLRVARENLGENEIGASQEAIAKGLLPVVGDKEETRSKTPDCCSLSSTTKS